MRKSKIMLSVLLVVALIISTMAPFGIGVAADDSIFGGTVTWQINEDKTVLTIGGVGNMPNFEYVEDRPWLVYRTSIHTVVIDRSVTGICDYAFEGLENLAHITIPNAVERIGKHAFSNTALYSNSENWEKDILYVDSWLICGNGVYKDYTVQNGTRGIANDAFSSGTVSGDLTIPGSVRNIGNEAFAYQAMDCVFIEDGVKTIGDMAFIACANLGGVQVSGTVESIGQEAFGGCRNLETVVLEDGVKELGYRAFYGCKALNNIVFPESLMRVGYEALGDTGLYYNKDNWKGPDAAEFVVNNWLLDMNDKWGPLYTGYSLRKSLRGIGDSALEKCTGLSSSTIPDGVVSVGKNAYAQAKNMKEVTIGASVKEIGEGAFRNCLGLTDVYYNGTKVSKNRMVIGEGNAHLFRARWHYMGGVELGDANNDGKIDSTDARLTLQYFVGSVDERALDLDAADVNGDNEVDSTDARLILQYFVGSITEFPRV